MSSSLVVSDEPDFVDTLVNLVGLMFCEAHFVGMLIEL